MMTHPKTPEQYANLALRLIAEAEKGGSVGGLTDGQRLLLEAAEAITALRPMTSTEVYEATSPPHGSRDDHTRFVAGLLSHWAG